MRCSIYAIEAELYDRLKNTVFASAINWGVSDAESSTVEVYEEVPSDTFAYPYVALDSYDQNLMEDEFKPGAYHNVIVYINAYSEELGSAEVAAIHDKMQQSLTRDKLDISDTNRQVINTSVDKVMIRRVQTPEKKILRQGTFIVRFDVRDDLDQR